VRQEYLCVLVNEYGFSLDQMDEEVSTPGERGTRGARADFLIWRTVQDRRDGKKRLIVVECKADNVAIDQKVYVQGSNWAQWEHAKFFVTHNRRSTKFWKVDQEKRAPNYSEIKDIPHANASNKEIDDLLAKLKPFEGKEFATCFTNATTLSATTSTSTPLPRSMRSRRSCSSKSGSSGE
jgi:type I restriction enzyme M protein